MKPLALVLVALAGGWIAGCASDTPPAEVVEKHLERGASGQGQLGPINRGPDDPFIQPRVGDSTP